MPYRDEYHPKVKSDLKKIDKEAVKGFFDTHLDKVLREPYKSEELHGNLEGVFSYHFRKNRVDYRAAYTVDENNKTVYIVMVGKRESFYEILSRRLS